MFLGIRIFINILMSAFSAIFDFDYAISKFKHNVFRPCEYLFLFKLSKPLKIIGDLRRTGLSSSSFIFLIALLLFSSITHKSINSYPKPFPPYLVHRRIFFLLRLEESKNRKEVYPAFFSRYLQFLFVPHKHRRKAYLWKKWRMSSLFRSNVNRAQYFTTSLKTITALPNTRVFTLTNFLVFYAKCVLNLESR